MDSIKRFNDSEISERMTSIPTWSWENDALHRVIKFPDFVTAFGFMSAVALRAEKMNHHPDWSNVYATVSISLSTHDVGGISAKDFELARALDELAARFE